MSEHNRATGDPEDPESAARASDVDTTDGGTSAPADRDDGPVRRPLIRATLKHPEGTPPTPREPPVFTMHQNQPGAKPSRGQKRNGRPVRSGGNPNNQNSSRDRSSQKASSRGNGGGNNSSPRPDRGQRSGNRSSSRRNKGRSR